MSRIFATSTCALIAICATSTIATQAFAAQPQTLQQLLPAGLSNATVTIPKGTYVLPRPLVVRDMRNVTIIGDGVTLRSGGSFDFIQLIGAHNVRVTGLTIRGIRSARMPSTGSRPAVMVGSINPKESGINDHIELDHLNISGANWAGIMVYGRYGAISKLKNTYISIHDNTVKDSSNGIFIYKNAKNVRIFNNRIDRTAQDGIAIDTRAATDPVVTEPSFDISATNNIISNCGLLYQGIGILAKGRNVGLVITGNKISNVGIERDYRGPIAVGVAVVQDFGHQQPSSVTVSDNDIASVWPGSKGGYDIMIPNAVNHLVVKRNSSSDVARFYKSGS